MGIDPWSESWSTGIARSSWSMAIGPSSCPSQLRRRLVAVAGVVVIAALVGCWATAGVHAARSCVGELEACCCSLSLPCFPRSTFYYDNDKPRQHMSCPKHDDDGHPNNYESTTQRAAAATTTTQRRWFNHTGNDSKTSSNNNAIDINGKRQHEGKLKRR
ncbi:hypothetical protein EDB89DRAFT_1904240 [Lactarius sanguifluus]|nr:hypothetical protein EDB89DRAFT_1904240 [Lactarius sanguifluus]